MWLNIYAVWPFMFVLFLNLPSPTAAGLLENGDDFSNNLVSDLAPLLALFGERVTTQFMSQSTGWADCIALAMAPIGVITIIVSAIRVGGPRILKAVIGRARENVAAAELEVMSSTSPEACELWNSQTRAVVRCPGTTDNCEFVCIYPKSMRDEDTKKEDLRVQVMELEKSVAPNDPEVSTGGAHHYLRNVESKRSTDSLSQAVQPNTIIITRNPNNKAPNMTLNCVADGDHWQVRACAAIGIVLQAGVLVFFGFLTEYETLKFDNDGTPVESYAMPMAVIGTLAVSLGILICAYVVDGSSKEETYEAINKDSSAVAMVWLQKEKNVSDQHFDSAAIYPAMTRHQACTSQRMDEKEQVNFSIMRQKLSSKILWLELMTTTGTLTSLLGFFIQFIGLRGMHWLASIAQLGAVIIMTILRALIRRHLAQGLSSVDLKVLTGFELEWFVTSLLDADGIKWIPGDRQGSKSTSSVQAVVSKDEKVLNKVSQFNWLLRTGASKHNSLEFSDADTSDSPKLSFQEVSDLSKPQSILELRRHLGELSGWHGPASKEALAVAQAIEKTMNLFMPYNNSDPGSGALAADNTSSTDFADDIIAQTTDSRRLLHEVDQSPFPTAYSSEQRHVSPFAIDSSRLESEHEDDFESEPDDVEHGRDMEDTHARRPKVMDWTVGVDSVLRQPDSLHSQTEGSITINLKNSPNDGWSVPVDMVDAALSFWLFSVKEHRILRSQKTAYPCGNDHWMRGGLLQEQKGLRILGPVDSLLVRDLEWWMPDGLDRVFEAEMRETSDVPLGFSHDIRSDRIGLSGERWLNTAPKTHSKTNLLSISSLNHRGVRMTYWKWKPADKDSFVSTEDPKDREDNQLRRLVAMNEDPLSSHQAKDLFSSFLWSLASHLGTSVVSRRLQAEIQPTHSRGPGSWKEFSLENKQLSQLVRSIADLGLWTEWEVWASFIPPLSATDNLPGLEAVIQMVQDSGASLERDLAWDQAGSSYRWLFDVGGLSPPGSHICAKSTAILWRFYQRLPKPGSPLFDESDDIGVNLLSRESSETLEKLRQQKDGHRDLQVAVKRLFYLHDKLTKLADNFSEELLEFQHRLYYRLDEPFTQRTVYEEFRSVGDIFDRTELHHVLQSTFIDHATINGGKLQFKNGRSRQELKRILPHYIERIAKAVEVVRKIELYPLRLLVDLYSAIFLPVQTFSRLLENGVDVNSRDLDHLTPLHYACESVGPTERDDYYLHREEARIEALLLNKADINAQDLQGNTPLHLAVRSSRYYIADLLVKRGCNVHMSNLEGRTPLHLATMLEDTDVLSMLLSAKSEINYQDKAGQTPLHIAVTIQNPYSTKMLVDKGAKQGISDKKRKTPLILAASLHMLSAFGNNIQKSTLDSAILQAAEDGVIEALGPLMERTNRDSWPPKDHLNRTPFHLAADDGLRNPEVIVMMIQKAKDLNFKPEGILEPKNETTALSVAAAEGMLDLAKGILKNVNPEIRKQILEQANESGMTPLFWSVYNAQSKAFSYLVDQETDMRTRTNDGENLLHAAVSFSSSDITRVVIGKIKTKLGLPALKSMLDERNEDGRTPRDEAEWHKILENVELLDLELNHLASLDLKD